ncbi:MAG TPA: metallopeptidase family protein [Anaerolineae bacterium]|nr:metallopeptidase family protein [Anaerolineae bacterium]
MNRSRFERLVAEALDSLPLEFQKKMENVDVVIEAWPSREEVERAGLSADDSLFGLYEGVPLTERTTHYGLVLPDKITIYQGPIEACCRSAEEVRGQVRQVVMHELGHHFGISDERLRDLGVY